MAHKVVHLDVLDDTGGSDAPFRPLLRLILSSNLHLCGIKVLVELIIFLVSSMLLVRRLMEMRLILVKCSRLTPSCSSTNDPSCGISRFIVMIRRNREDA